MKVSILIPLYNSERYIAETIQSAFYQTHSNIEIIVIDDGSTDNSYNIAKQYESENVKVFKQNNAGASSARNKAFSYSSGDLIQYLDADDILHPDKIKKQVKEYKASNTPNCIISGVWGRFENDIENVKWEYQTLNKDYNSPLQWLIDSWNGMGMAQPGVWLTPRHIIEKAGPWNESLSLNDDGEFFCRVLLNADSIKFVNSSKVYYRSNITSSLSQTRSNKALMSELSSYLLYSKNIINMFDSLDLRKALGNNLLHFAYQYYNLNKKLADRALLEFKNLNIGKPWPIGGKIFKQLSMLIGFVNALKFKSIIKF